MVSLGQEKKTHSSHLINKQKNKQIYPHGNISVWIYDQLLTIGLIVSLLSLYFLDILFKDIPSEKSLIISSFLVLIV